MLFFSLHFLVLFVCVFLYVYTVHWIYLHNIVNNFIKSTCNRSVMKRGETGYENAIQINKFNFSSEHTICLSKIFSSYPHVYRCIYFYFGLQYYTDTENLTHPPKKLNTLFLFKLSMNSSSEKLIYLCMYRKWNFWDENVSWVLV